MFFHEAKKADIPVGMSGASWLHHFGSITQSAMKQERGLSEKKGLGCRYNYRLLHQSWLDRKLNKIRRIRQQKLWCEQEIAEFGISMHGIRNNGGFSWE
jgi:hypothetical protein